MLERPRLECVSHLSHPSSTVETYVEEVTKRLKELLGADLVGVYLHGSVVLGDFSEGRSDVDVVAVSSRPLSPEEKKAVAERLSQGWCYLDEGVLCSKTAGGEWVRERVGDPSTIDAALRHRRELTDAHPDPEAALAFLLGTLQRLERSVARTSQPPFVQLRGDD